MLESNRQQAPSNIEGFKHTFGKSKTWQPLNEQEFEARRQAQIKALYALRADRTGSRNQETKDEGRGMMEDTASPFCFAKATQKPATQCKEETKDNEQ